MYMERDFGEWFSWYSFRKWHVQSKAVVDKHEKCEITKWRKDAKRKRKTSLLTLAKHEKNLRDVSAYVVKQQWK